MMKPFRLMAIVNEKKEWELKEVLLDDSLHKDLANKWEKQYKAFMGRTEEIDFKETEPGYKLDNDQAFRICSYCLPTWLAGRNSENIMNTEQIDINENLANSIKGVVAFARNDEDNELMLFQHFAPGQIIRPKSLMRAIKDLDSRHTYTSVEDSTFRLNENLTAVYSSKDEKLLFNHFRNAKKFIPSLIEIYDDLSNQAIDNHVLSHSLFECEAEDKAEVLGNVTQNMRTAFTRLKDSGILDYVSVKGIQETAAENPEKKVKIQTKHNKIVFPTEKDDIKALLDLLNENMFRGPFTKALYMTNSKRKVSA